MQGSYFRELGNKLKEEENKEGRNEGFYGISTGPSTRLYDNTHTY